MFCKVIKRNQNPFGEIFYKYKLFSIKARIKINKFELFYIEN